MDSILLSTISSLSDAQRAALKRGNILSISDLLLTSPIDVARKCKISLIDAQGIINAVVEENKCIPRRFSDVQDEGGEVFTTGDVHLDDALGGGIRTGMVWEVVGESAAGKTQLALQLALLVQIPPNLGGISGSTCYLTISSKLPTSRLKQLAEAHPLLSPSLCNLSEIHTIATESISKLLYVLSKSLPGFLHECSGKNSKPVKLLVIDALAELFRSTDKTTTATLVERSRNISEVSTLLHALANKYQIAVLVLNEVVDVFHQGPCKDTNSHGDLIYRDQAQWFNRADSVPGENRKEASLGLVWANQVNVRILLTRTGRRRHLDEVAAIAKKQRRIDSCPLSVLNNPHNVQTAALEDQSTLIRRLSVIFSSISLPTSLDYVVAPEGICAMAEYRSHVPDVPSATTTIQDPPATSVPLFPESTAQISHLDEGSVHDDIETADAAGELQDDEWDTYWNEDTCLEQVYSSTELDALLDPIAAAEL